VIRHAKTGGSDHAPSSLARTDAEPIEAESGYATLEAWPDHSFAPILLDGNMPTWAVSKWPASVIEDERSRDTPIIFLGAADDDMSRLTGYGSGVVDYIVKRDVFGEAGWQEPLRAGITVCLRSGNQRLGLRLGLRTAKLV